MMESITVLDKQMVATDTPYFPLLDVRPVSNSAYQWVALSVRIDEQAAAPAVDPAGEPAPGHNAWQAVFNSNDLLTAVAPLDCILHVTSLAPLTPALCARLPASRVLFAIDAACLSDQAALRQAVHLQQAGYRLLIDGAAGNESSLPATLRAIAHDCGAPMVVQTPLAALFGPHLAHGVDTPTRFDAALKAGFAWFSGKYPLTAASGEARTADDGITARRLLKLLGLLLADAETRDIETQLKQDPGLCYHLLRLVNSAAFALATPIHDFAQAIDRLGRRQLLRWLQLLLYTRPRGDGMGNPLLPIAAMRAAQIESLCKQQGRGRDQQDLAFQVGVFSLLDVLLGMPMGEIVDALCLPPDSAGALLERSGSMGALLALVEADAPPARALARAHVTLQQWWHSQLHGLHWAIQVSRNL